jgi:malonate-semialdehyde dehydrogenase (acetylating)/methylmalonate-semialdehyde dehydrogenase
MQVFEDGSYVGGTLFDHVTPEMPIYRDEIFGPVLSLVRRQTYQEAVVRSLRCPLWADLSGRRP